MTLSVPTLRILQCTGCGSALRHQPWHAGRFKPQWTDGCTADTAPAWVMVCSACGDWLEPADLPEIERVQAPRLGEAGDSPASRHWSAALEAARRLPSLVRAEPAALARGIASLALPPEDEQRWRLQVWQTLNDGYRRRPVPQAGRIAGIVAVPARRPAQGLARDNLERLLDLTRRCAEPMAAPALWPAGVAFKLGVQDERLLIADMLRHLGRHGEALATLDAARRGEGALDSSFEPWARVIRQLAWVGDTRVRRLVDDPATGRDRLSAYLDAL